jgi:hypothetical protein
MFNPRMFIQGEIVKTFDYCKKYSKILYLTQFEALLNEKWFIPACFFLSSVALTCSFDESKKHKVQIEGDENYKYRVYTRGSLDCQNMGERQTLHAKIFCTAKKR